MATTTKITLTKVPQLIATGACYLQSRNGDFYFAFGTIPPTNLSICHFDNKLYTNGDFGNIYAWKVVEHPVSLFVTK